MTTRLSLRALPLWFVLLTLLAPILAAPARAAETPALTVKLWATPSSVQRGDVVSYEMTIENSDAARASRVRVTLPLSGYFTVVKTSFDNRATWVEGLDRSAIIVMFGRLNRSERRTATVYVKIGADAPSGLTIDTTARLRHDDDGGEAVKSNRTTIAIVGAPPAHGTPTGPHASVAPASAPSGARLMFQIGGYFPQEPISTWLNAPDGVRETRLSGRTDDHGDLTLTFATAKLAPGSYSMVIYGATSTATVVVPFTMTP